MKMEKSRNPSAVKKLFNNFNNPESKVSVKDEKNFNGSKQSSFFESIK